MWFTHEIANISKPLEYAIYLHEKLRLIHQSENLEYKDMSSVQTSELAEAKISFLNSLFVKKNSQLLDPVEKIEDIHLLIDVSNDDIVHEASKKASRKLP